LAARARNFHHGSRRQKPGGLSCPRNTLEYRLPRNFGHHAAVLAGKHDLMAVAGVRGKARKVGVAAFEPMNHTRFQKGIQGAIDRNGCQSRAAFSGQSVQNFVCADGMMRARDLLQDPYAEGGQA
jgi:hypothetical protein